MADVGIFLSSEEHGPRALLDQARMAEEAGFTSILISDHYHPWVDRQGEAPFVWSVIGGIAACTKLKVTTGVTCPIMRIHPVVLAQAAATSQQLLDGRFVLGVGSGENLNEHVLGDRWPPIATRLEMLEEAVAVMRDLWTGSLITRHGRYYTVENARLYSLPETPPPVLVSAFGDASLALAATIGDGFVTTQPDGSAVRHYRSGGGGGRAIAATKVCFGEDEAACRRLAHELWAVEQLPGQLNQELALPSHFEQAVDLVDEDMVAEKVPCGPDPDRHAEAIRRYLEAGFDEVYVNQIGPDQHAFFEFYNKELRCRLES